MSRFIEQNYIALRCCFTYLLGISLLCTTSFIADQVTSKRIYSFTGTAQGTSYKIKYKYHEEAIKQFEIDSLFHVFELSLSRYNPSALLYKLNKPKRTARIDNHLNAVLLYSHEMMISTNGCFDYRLLPLLKLWGFGSKKQLVKPDSNKIIKKLEETVSSSLFVNKLIAHKSTKNLAIDLDGIAQGYCVDQLTNFIEQKHVTDFVVELGGEVYVSGTDMDNKAWKIGLGDEHFSGKKHEEVILTNMDKVGITTSGSLQKFIKIGNEYFSHIIDPRTGYPVQNGIVSVTVIAPTAMLADALDNAFMVMGKEKSFEWCRQYSDIGCYIVYVNPEGRLVDTANSYFNRFLQIKN